MRELVSSLVVIDGREVGHFSSNCILQKLSFISNFEKVVALLSWLDISLSTGALYCSNMIALFRS